MTRKKAQPTFAELSARIEAICRHRLQQTSPDVRTLTAEVALWAYYPHLKVATLMGHLLWDGEAAGHVQPFHSATDLFPPATIRAALREHVLYLRIRSVNPDGGFTLHYLFPGWEIYRFDVSDPSDAERVYYDAEALIRLITAPKKK